MPRHFINVDEAIIIWNQSVQTIREMQAKQLRVFQYYHDHAQYIEAQLLEEEGLGVEHRALLQEYHDENLTRWANARYASLAAVERTVRDMVRALRYIRRNAHRIEIEVYENDEWVEEGCRWCSWSLWFAV